MDTQKNIKKLVILGMVLLIIAGVVIVLLKGFNVSLEYGKHEEVEIKLDVDVDLAKVEEAAKETFGDKYFIVKKLEVFGDSAQIVLQAITDTEKETLVTKLNEKFGTEKNVDDLKVYATSNRRLRDTVRPFILPMVISYVIVFVYMLIKYRKSQGVRGVLITILKQILLVSALISVVAVTRIQVNDFIIGILVLIGATYLTYCVSCGEKEEN